MRPLMLLSALVTVSSIVAAAPPDKLRQMMDDPFHKTLYANTYKSLLERVEPDGFFQESLTGAYAGMFPRTVGGLVSLFIETGELDACERLINCVIAATQANKMERIPHVFDRRRVHQEPEVDEQNPGQINHSVALYRLDNGYYGMQKFMVPEKPVKAIEVYLAIPPDTGNFCASIHEAPESAAIWIKNIVINSDKAFEGWFSVQLDPAPKLEPGKEYWFKLAYTGTARPIWFGVNGSTNKNFNGSIACDPAPANVRLNHPDYVTAIALDTGSLKKAERVNNYPILSNRDEIDGQAHVIMAWGRLANLRGATPFEDATYPFIAQLLDRSTDWPYILYGDTHADLGLVRNVSLEHSREVRMWDTYDILTQSFMGAALESCIQVAKRRGDDEHAKRWTERLDLLKKAIDKHLTRMVDDKKVYLEMRLPNSDTGVPFEGLGWLNFAPVSAQWQALDPAVLDNTVDLLRKIDTCTWHGLKWLGTDWTPGQGPSPQVIGKGVGWEIDYARQRQQWDRICEWLDFIKAVNSSPIYLEAANYDASTDKWTLQDPGNGEQCSWWCWGMARLHKALVQPK